MLVCTRHMYRTSRRNISYIQSMILRMSSCQELQAMGLIWACMRQICYWLVPSFLSGEAACRWDIWSSWWRRAQQAQSTCKHPGFMLASLPFPCPRHRQTLHHQAHLRHQVRARDVALGHRKSAERSLTSASCCSPGLFNELGCTEFLRKCELSMHAFACP